MINAQISETAVPYFPFPIRRTDNGGYSVVNHLMTTPIRLNTQAAEVLRLTDGVRSVDEIIRALSDAYPDAGNEALSGNVTGLLGRLSEDELIWWRQVPIKPVPVGPPTSVFCEITAACNLRCQHCVVAAGKRSGGELGTERWIQLFDEMAAYGVQGVAFSGGEPLVHRDFRTLVEHAGTLGLALQVATNGTLVTPEIARWLKELDAEVQVSLDGSTAEIHDRMRPGNKAFARATAGIRALVDAGHELTIGMVLTRHNLDDVPAMLALVQSLGATHFRLIPFVPKGRGEKFADMEVTPEQMREVTRYLHEQREKSEVHILTLEFEEMIDGGPGTQARSEEKSLGCSGAVAYGTVTPVGELLPCHFFSGVRADSVARKSFGEVWRRSRFLNYFRNLSVDDLHGACAGCSWLPQCGGSCRAVNFAKGDLFGTNRGCWIAAGEISG